MTTPRADIGAEAVRGEDGGDGSPDELLATAVLRMALDDLTEPQRCADRDDPVEHLQDARRFCFSSDPEWARSRQHWCELANVDPQYFQRQAAQRCAAFR